MKISAKNISRSLIILTGGLILASVIFSFYKYYIDGNYYLYAKIACDPNTEICFHHECEDDVRCGESEMFFYKIANISSKSLRECGSNVDCIDMACEMGKCEIEYCSEESIDLYELEDTCTVPSEINTSE